MTRLGVGVLGCGAMGSHHALNLQRIEGVDVVAVADVVPAAAHDLAGMVSARIVDSHELIGDDEVDAVVIATPDETHCSLATSAIRANKPVLLEKPLAHTVEQASAVVEAEIKAGRQLVTLGFMRELDPAHLEVRHQLETLGPITKIRCVHRNVDAKRRETSMLFSQSMIHDIHTVRWLSGSEFLSVSTHVAERPDGFRDVLIVGRLDDGSLAQIEFEDQAFAYEVHVEVTTVGGMVATLPHPNTVRRSHLSETLSVGDDWFGRFTDAYRAEIEHWTHSVLTETVSGPGVGDGYKAQLVAEAAMKSLDTGSVVSIDEVSLAG